MPSSFDRMRFLDAERGRMTDQLARLESLRQHREDPVSPDFSEQIQQCQNDPVVEKLEAAARATLAQLDRAIERLSKQQGELCEDCGQAIDVARLKVLPAATRCRNCEEHRPSR